VLSTLIAGAKLTPLGLLAKNKIKSITGVKKFTAQVWIFSFISNTKMSLPKTKKCLQQKVPQAMI